MNEADELPPNLPFAPELPSHGGSRLECCPSIQPDLDLYAEGELSQEPRVRRVRRHLQECVACRDYLEGYDALTRAILSGDPRAAEALEDAPLGPDSGFAGGEEDGARDRLEHGRRVEAIMARIHGEACPVVECPAVGRGSVGSPVRSADTGERLPGAAVPGGRESGLRLPLDVHRRFATRAARFLLSAAAAIAFGLVLLWGVLPRRDAVDLEIPEVAGSALPGGGTGAEGDAAGSGDPASDESAFEKEPEVPGLRWVVDSGLRTQTSGSGFPAGSIRLLGFRSSLRARGSPETRLGLEWVVHAALHGRPLAPSEARYFLVSEDFEPEGSSSPRPAGFESAGPSSAPETAPTEIAPLAWYPPAEPEAVAVRRPGERAYKVYVIPGLRVPFVATENEEGRFLLPSVRPRGLSAWTLPASFER